MLEIEATASATGSRLIGNAAAATGLSRKTIRYYEREGLLPEVPRTPSGYRFFGGDHISRLHFISQARDAGLSIKDIRSILTADREQQHTCDVTRDLLRRELASTRERITELHRRERHLIKLLDKGTSDLRDSSDAILCPLLEHGPAMS